MKFDEPPLDVTVSIGVAEIQAGDDMASFLGHADMALTAAKQNGRNRVYYYDGRGCLPIDESRLGGTSREQKLDEPDATLSRKELRRMLEPLFLRTEYIAPYVGGLPEYLAWFLNQPIAQRYFISNAEGTTTPSIRKQVLEVTPVILPSLKQQKIIVELAQTICKEKQVAAKIIANGELLMHTLLNEISQTQLNQEEVTPC